MSQITDNLIAYRILSMLVTPFVETDAYKLGIIDENGNNLIKSRDFVKPEQRDAYNYLTRLAFNLKKILAKTPGGDNKTKSLVASLFLIKEAYLNNESSIDQFQFESVLKLLEHDVQLEEHLIVKDFLMLKEDAPANSTGPAVSTDVPVIRKTKRFTQFDVDKETYDKFKPGKAKFRKISTNLDLKEHQQKMIYDFICENPDTVVILRNGNKTKYVKVNLY